MPEVRVLILEAELIGNSTFTMYDVKCMICLLSPFNDVSESREPLTVDRLRSIVHSQLSIEKSVLVNFPILIGRNADYLAKTT